MSKIKIKILCDLTDYKGIEEKLINAGFEVSVDARFALVNVINNDITGVCQLIKKKSSNFLAWLLDLCCSRGVI